MFGGSPAMLSHDAGTVRVIDVELGIIRLRQGGELRERSEIAVHAKDAIRNDKRPSAMTSFREEGIQVLHVVMAVHSNIRTAQAASVEETCMTETICEYKIASTYQRRNRPNVREIS